MTAVAGAPCWKGRGVGVGQWLVLLPHCSVEAPIDGECLRPSSEKQAAQLSLLLCCWVSFDPRLPLFSKAFVKTCLNYLHSCQGNAVLLHSEALPISAAQNTAVFLGTLLAMCGALGAPSTCMDNVLPSVEVGAVHTPSAASLSSSCAGQSLALSPVTDTKWPFYILMH